MKKICGAALLIGLLSFASACADEGPAAAPVETGDVSLDATVDGGSQDAAADLTVNELPPDVVSDGVGDVGPDIVEIIEPEVTMDVPPEVEDVGPVACDPLLALETSSSTALPYSLVELHASGGTGDYRFELVDDQSGALVHPLLGSYLAGGQVGTHDEVELTDQGCIGSATLTISVVPHLSLAPLHAEVSPLEIMNYEFVGGSGEILCEMALANSGGAVSVDGSYQAGPDEGTDVVRCVDTQTDELVEATVEVVTGAGIVLSPAQIVIPAGSTYLPRVLGGSGHFTYETPPSGLGWVDGRFVAEEVGRYTVAVTDDFISAEATLTVDVIEHLQANPKRAGVAGYQGHARTADIDGDGHMDALLGFYESSHEAYLSGAVYIYQGTETGLALEPVRVISGLNRRDFVGRSVSLADFNGDGLVDLAVGADGYEMGAVDAGAIFLYYGQEGAFFEAEPSVVLPAPYSYDHLGYSMTSCDFNGDGWMDLAGGALYGENRDLDVAPTNQGAVYLWLGSASGFGLTHDQAIYGKIPDASGAWIDMPYLGLAWQAVSGDMDGDGACELAVTSRAYSSGSGRSNDGAVFVYKGVLADETTSGGIASLPHIAWGGVDADDASTEVGRNALMADVTGDGLADLMVSQHRHNDPEAVSGTNQGTLRLFLGGTLPQQAGPAEILSVSLSHWKSQPYDNGDQGGWSAAVGDMDGDEQLDLLVGALSDEVDGGPTNTGSVALYKGVPGQVPEPAPSMIYAGELGGDTFGLCHAPLGDADGDGVGDLFVLAPRHDELGPDVGRPYFVSGADGLRTPLEFPGQAAGSLIGASLAVVGDLDGDGYPEALVGAPEMELDAFQAVQVGAVMLHKGTAEGFSLEPSVVYSAFNGHSSGDRLGWAVADAGDFDGDGHRDIALLSRYDDQPNTKTTYSHDGTCGGSRSNTGAVYIFRGSGDALPEAEPDFVWYGPQNSQTLRVITAGLDINGDGLDDFVAGGADLDRPGAAGAGGFGVVFGRPQDSSGKTNMICAHNLDWVGLVSNDNTAWSVTGVGDLNADGCADFAVGARVEDIPSSSQGSVRVFFGWGGAGCPAEPTYVFLYPDWGGSQAGYAVAGGQDVTGDGVPDLLVGGPRMTINGDTVGAAWLVPGDYIASLPAELVVDGVSPGEIHPFIPPAATTGLWRYDGETDDEWLGHGVALIPNGTGPGVASMAISSTFSGLNGTAQSGAVRVVRWNADPASTTYGFEPAPQAVVGGETWRTGSRFGEILAAGTLDDTPVLLVGGPQTSAIGLDEGAAWMMKLAP